MSTTLDRPATETGTIDAPRGYETLEGYRDRGFITQEQIDQARGSAVIAPEPAPPATPPITADASMRVEQIRAEAYARNLMERYGIPAQVIESVVAHSRIGGEQDNEFLVNQAISLARRCNCTGARSDFLWR